jgi:hypothetical protein
MRTRYSILAIICLLLFSGCAKKNLEQSESFHFVFDRSPDAENKLGDRYTAVKHWLVVETPESEVAKVWESTIKLCSSIKCDVLNSSIAGQTVDLPPRGELALRIIPGDLSKLFEHLEKSSTISEHRTESETKTEDVIDVEARQRNMTELRDRLRSLLIKAPASVKELVELERELATVQSSIDSLAMRRKVLANETENIAVHIGFQPSQSIARTGILAPIANAWHSSGLVLSESFGALVTFIFALIPWLIIIIPSTWLIVRILRRRSRKQKPPSKTE